MPEVQGPTPEVRSSFALPRLRLRLSRSRPRWSSRNLDRRNWCKILPPGSWGDLGMSRSEGLAGSKSSEKCGATPCSTPFMHSVYAFSLLA